MVLKTISSAAPHVGLSFFHECFGPYFVSIVPPNVEVLELIDDNSRVHVGDRESAIR